MADIFISYAGEDRERIRPLAEALTALGYDVWWDRARAAGEEYAEVIARELAAAKTVLVVWTRASVQSAFIREEAERALTMGSLLPVRLDAIEPPGGFEVADGKDLVRWGEGADAPNVEALDLALRARLGRKKPKRAAKPQAPKADQAGDRVTSVATSVVAITAVSVAAFVLMTSGVGPRPPRTAAFAPLAAAAARGTLGGDQAVELAQLLEPIAPADRKARVPAETAIAIKRTFDSAAAELLRSPDADARAALLSAAEAKTRADGLAEIERMAAKGGAAAATLWRASGALRLAGDDPRALEALEKASAANPHDKEVWRLLATAYGEAGRPKDSDRAGAVASALDASADGAWPEAQAALERALTLTEAGRERGFILGKLGDVAVAREDVRTAEARYAAALDVGYAAKDEAAIALDSAKLARAQMRRGGADRACATLKAAHAKGAAVSADDLDDACAEAARAALPIKALAKTPDVQ